MPSLELPTIVLFVMAAALEEQLMPRRFATIVLFVMVGESDEQYIPSR